jgi:hypothetical protein
VKSFISVLFISLFLTGFIFSQDGLGVWTQTYNNYGRIYCIAINQTNQNIIYIAGLDSGVYKTTTGGLDWAQINNGLTYFHIQCFAISKSNPNILFAGTDTLASSYSTCGLYRSTDAGGNWTLVSGDITDSKGIQAIIVHPTNPNIVYCGVFNAVAVASVGIWKSTNGGTNWFSSSTGVDNKQILSMVYNPLNPNVLYAGTSMATPSSSLGPCKIFKTYDEGANWMSVVNGIPQTTSDNNPVRCLSISSSDTSVVLAGLFENASTLTGGVYLTTNGGQLWTKKQNGILDSVYMLPRACLIKPGSSTEFYVGLDRNVGSGSIGIYSTTNGGNNWANFNGGTLLSTYSVRALAFKTTENPTLYAGASSSSYSAGRGLFEYSWQAVNARNVNTDIPETYDLLQNYPNPFNPVTRISYQLPVSDYIKLSVYDMLGREVAVLFDGYKKAGYYDYEFNGSNFSSGIYFYRIYTEKFVSTKKMILTK